MNQGSSDRVDEIAAAIMGHLRAFPDARDTAHGIRDWWLPKRLRDASFEEVDDALRRLEDAGQLVVTRNPDGTPIYAAAPSRPRSRDP